MVEPDFSIPNHPEIRVVGDLCCYKHTRDGNQLPGMAGPATQAGGFVGKDIAAIVAGGSRPNFSWFDFGSMAVLDRVDAVELDRIVDTNYDPHVKAGVRLVSVISDNLQHAGQARYLRGIIERLGV